MKKILLLLLMLPLVACGQREKHEMAIERYYQSHLNDPSSYELVRMGIPKAVTRVSAIYKVGIEKGVEWSRIEEEASKYASELKSQGIDPVEIIAYEVEHRYRANNALGALVLENEVVVLDPTMSEVIKVLPNEK